MRAPVADDRLLNDARALRAEIERDKVANQRHWERADEALTRAVRENENALNRTESRGLQLTVALLVLQVSAATAATVQLLVSGDFGSPNVFDEIDLLVAPLLLLLPCYILLRVAITFVSLKQSTRVSAELTLRLKERASGRDDEGDASDESDSGLPATVR